MLAVEKISYQAAIERLGAADDVVANILDIAGARQLALDALLRLSSVEWSADVATACVECVDRPRLLLNPRFVAIHCAAPRELAFLLLHELAHISLGHTGLYLRITPAQNVAFDAYINASLLQRFANLGTVTDGWDALPTSFYSATKAPEFMLRPPPGWPTAPDWTASEGLPDEQRALHRRLYECADGSGRRAGVSGKRWQSVTYGELLRALTRLKDDTEGTDTAGDDSDGADRHGSDTAALEGRLLGGHGTTDAERRVISSGRDANSRSVLADVLAELPNDPSAGPALGGNPLSVELRGAVDERLTRALRALMLRALTAGTGERRWTLAHRPVWTVDPTRDRRAHVRRHVARTTGAPTPMLFAGEIAQRRPAQEHGAAIYLDVSGSMGPWAGRLHAALVPLRRMLAPQLFVFSTIVESYSRDAFVRGRVQTTGGTDITPVLKHLADHAAARKIRRALVLTDGYVGTPSRKVLKDFLATGVLLHVGITGTKRIDCSPWAASVTLLTGA